MAALDAVEKVKEEQIDFEIKLLDKKNKNTEEKKLKIYPILGNLSMPEYVLHHLKKIKVLFNLKVILNLAW